MQEEENSNIKVCRFCLDPNSSEELITPCACTGEYQYAHRSCLNAYRIYYNDPVAFGKCLLCGVDYTFKHELSRPMWALFIRAILRFLYQIFLTTTFMLLVVIISGGMVYYPCDAGIREFLRESLEYSRSEIDELTSSAGYVILLLLAGGLLFDCFLLGLWSVLGMTMRCFNWMCDCCKDIEEDELSYKDIDRMSSCCGLTLCCTPFLWRKSFLYNLGCCFGCIMCPNTVPICCCRSNHHYIYHYPRYYHYYRGPYHPRPRAAGDCAICCAACIPRRGVPIRSSGKGGAGIGLALLIIVVIIICIGAVVGTFAAIVFIIYLLHKNYYYISKEVECEKYIIDNWDPEQHPAPTRQPPIEIPIQQDGYGNQEAQPLIQPNEQAYPIPQQGIEMQPQVPQVVIQPVVIQQAPQVPVQQNNDNVPPPSII